MVQSNTKRGNAIPEERKRDRFSFFYLNYGSGGPPKREPCKPSVKPLPSLVDMVS